MRTESAQNMKLHISQLTINNSTGAAMARIPGPPPKSGLHQHPAIVLQAAFVISAANQIPGFESVNLIPGTYPNMLFAHVHVTFDHVEGESQQLAEIEWPPEQEYRKTFAAMIAHMLAYAIQPVGSHPIVQSVR